MNKHFCKLLSTVSVLPALLVLPAFADVVNVSTWDELSAALTAGSDILVTQNITVAESLGITGQTNTLDLNGMTLAGGAGDALGVSVFSGSVLNLTNGGTISGFDRSNTLAGIINVQESSLYLDGDFTFQNNNSQRGVIQVWGNGEVPVVSSSATSVLTFNNNTSTMGGALYHEHRHAGDDVVSELRGTSITFSNNNATSTAGGAILNVVGNLSILGDNNTFSGNSTTNTTEVVTKHYKRGGGAIANASGDGTNNAVMIIGNADSINSFSGNTSTTNGGAIMNRAVDTDRDVYLTINGTSTFSGNTAAEKGGAIYNISQQIEVQDGEDNWVSQKRNELNLTGVSNVFTNNVAGQKGGAIYTSGYATIDNGLFTGNHTTGAAYMENGAWQQAQGGAIYNTGADELHEDDSDVYWTAEGILNISNTNFGIDGDALSGNSALQGGAIANNGGQGGFYDGNITLNNTNFYNNRAYADIDDDGYNFSSQGGAIWNDGIITVNGATVFKGNTAEGFDAEGGAVYNSGTLTFNDAVTFNSNIATDTNSNNGAQGGAISNEGTLTFADMATFIGNQAISNSSPKERKKLVDGELVTVYVPVTTEGGALHNANRGEVEFQNGALFDGNSATYGGAVFNDSLITFNDASFVNNIAGDEGGAIFNYDGTVNLNAVNDDIVFSGNFADNVLNDITNYYGTINFNAASGRSISLNGIDGVSGEVNKTGTGVLNVSEYIAFQTVNLDEGELHLTTGSDNLYQSTVNVASGATINTIDNLINDYAGSIVLSDGALVKGDLDYTNGLADLYSAVDGATIIYSMANPLDIGVQYGASKTIQVATGDNVTVNAGTGFAWFDSDHGLTLTSSGVADGSITVTGTSGGINSAVAVTNPGISQEIAYLITSDETFDGVNNVIQNSAFYITGDGNDNTASVLTLANDLVVGTDSVLSIEDAVLASASDTEKIETQLGAVLNIRNAYVGIEIDNAGTLRSDPTTYASTVTNTGTATFDADTFDTTAVLANSGVVELDNGVTFNSGAQITGAGVTNLVGGTTHFNSTASSNTINLSNGADFDGVLASTGVLNTQNNHIDSVTGSVTGGTLNIDASLIGAGTVDTFADATGATIGTINLLSSEYGDAQSLTMNVNGATLADDFMVTGATNYYTSIAIDSESGNLVFSDKLLNTSGFYDLLGADWSDGHYILNAADYDTVADSTHLTVGDALAALDAQVYANTAALDGKVDTTNVYTGTVANATIANSDNLVMSVTSFQNSMSNFVDNVALTWGQSQRFEDGVTFGESGAYGITGAGAATLGATSVSSLTMGGVTAGGIDTTVTADSSNLVTSGAVATALDGKQDVIDANHQLSAAFISGLSSAATTSVDTTVIADSSNLVTSGAVATALSGKQDVIDSEHLLGASLIDTDSTHQFVTAEQVSTWNGKQDAITEDNKLSASLIETDSDHQFVTQGQIDSWNALTGSGAGSVSNQIANNAQNATYSAGSHATGTIGAAIDDINTTVSTLTGSGAGSISNQIANNAQNATYSAGSHATGTIGAAIDDINGTIGTVHGLVASANATTTVNGDDYHGNLAVGTTVEDHLVSLDAAIGDMRNFGATDGTGNTYAVYDNVADNLTALDSAISALSLNGSGNGAFALGQANAYTDSRVETLDKNLSSGIASAVALSSVAVGGVRRGEMSVGAGYGYFNGQSAAAFGAAVGLSSRWSVNAGAGVSGYDVSFRAGTNYKFKVF